MATTPAGHPYWDPFAADYAEHERLVEPLPAPEMAHAYPEDDAKLRIEPGFIAFRLVKAPS